MSASWLSQIIVNLSAITLGGFVSAFLLGFCLGAIFKWSRRFLDQI